MLYEVITYTNSSDNPSTVARTINVVVTDSGGLNSNTATTTITFTAVNDAPVLDLDANNSTTGGANYLTSYTENGAPIPVADVDSLITDVDSTQLMGATLTLTNAQTGDVLSVGTLPAGISAVVNGNTVTLSGLASLSDYETALEAVRYANSSDNRNNFV